MVGQSALPGKRVILPTSRRVRDEMREWVPSEEAQRPVKLDVRDLRGQIGLSFRVWAPALGAGVQRFLHTIHAAGAWPMTFKVK